MSMQDIAFQAKQLSRTHHSGVLGTHSTSMPGYPFGSVVPYLLTPAGDAIIYISDIALHTRNIKANDKVSLTIFDAGEDDSQANGRVTIMGSAELAKQNDVKAQYFRLFPQAKKYEQTHDFNFYAIRTERVRFIGGFGKIHWVDKAYWSVEAQDWHGAPESMINHMNEDHQDAMQLILQHKKGVNVEEPIMHSVFPEGMHCGTEKQTWFVPFEALCVSSTDVRKALVKLTNDAREALNVPKAVS
ncbi:HugZ family pyridoxamine 5'-phosphate oxidase [Alteromonas sp.]|jgi:heme oxygenase (biliverdin-IX-beta and delta-forming)|uniref:HugZ family pyridoxamine 5'-phosphate oxidase n=1 Tax=Alteromonas sp. TaxID=232 RepID=UPI0025795D21|nr:DUF2470 domain-containing protein [Alteromonas sp.]NQY16336.1 DUF2470 domain-containing protein [Alteromonas sp.]